jgi:hypothetical protein
LSSWIELGLVLISLILAFCVPRLGSKLLNDFECGCMQLARRKRLSVLVVGLAALVARAAVFPILPVPQPYVTDEFSQLLLADTLLQGRLANPTHPMWIHFETPQVIMRPTYASMYPPAQGVFLALGRAIGRHPFVGVLISLGFMCAALCWMLQGWMTPGWALLGGFLAVVHFAVFSYWANSYWGAPVAAGAGALLLGALPRIMQYGRPRDAVVMGLGLGILANSRPYEGLILSLPVAFALFTWLFRQKGNAFQTSVRRVIVPLLLVVGTAGLMTAYYSWRITANPFRMPQQLDRETYAMAPYFLWQSAKPMPVYRNEAMRDLYVNYEMGVYNDTRTIQKLIALWIIRISSFWLFYLGPALTLPLAMAVVIVRYGLSWSRVGWPVRFFLSGGAFCILGLAMEVFFSPHYAAPVTGLVLALVLLAMGRLREWEWRTRPVGIFLTRAIPLVCLCALLLRATAPILHLAPGTNEFWTGYNARPVNSPRGPIESELRSYPGDQLALVRYTPMRDKSPQPGWVYNQANIDQARILWAWDMGPAENQELIEYFKNRHVWLVEADKQAPDLSPYPHTPVQ